MSAITLEESNEFAGRRLASFLRIPTEGGVISPVVKQWSLGLMPEGGPPTASWGSIDIYDIHGKLLFRDKSLPQSEVGMEFRVRTAADDTLQAPVWSVGSGPILDIASALNSARLKAVGLGLVPVAGPEALVCYSYPKLGLLCDTNSGERVVLDLWQYTTVPLDSSQDASSPESVFCWSPFDRVVPATAPLLRDAWSLHHGALPEILHGPNSLERMVRSARDGSQEATLGDGLVEIAQMHDMACVPASFTMILRYHGVAVTQTQVATAMETSVSTGTFPAKQAPAINPLTEGRFNGTFEPYPTFQKGVDEVNAGRPVKEGITGHARVFGGWRVDENGERWAYLFDPYPANVGQTPYWELWENVTRVNYVYVRAPVFHV